MAALYNKILISTAQRSRILGLTEITDVKGLKKLDFRKLVTDNLTAVSDEFPESVTNLERQNDWTRRILNLKN
jgi:hypothetical protein